MSTWDGGYCSEGAGRRSAVSGSALCPCQCFPGAFWEEGRRREGGEQLTAWPIDRMEEHTHNTTMSAHAHTHKAAHTAINRFLKSITVNKAAKWSETLSRRPNSLLSFESKNLDGQLYLMWHMQCERAGSCRMSQTPSSRKMLQEESVDRCVDRGTGEQTNEQIN